MHLSTKQPISRAGQSEPVIKIQDGYKVIEEKVPCTPYTRKFVDLNGHVKQVVLASGRTIGGTDNNPYGNQTWREKIKKGWLPYSHCPIAKGYVRANGEIPCDGPFADRPGEFDKPYKGERYRRIEDECCKHIEEAILARREPYEERMRELEEASMSDTKLLAKQLQEQQKRDAAKAVKEPKKK